MTLSILWDKVAETADWKQKYRDSLVEMEAEEVRWRHVEQVLRRLVGRLCAAGMGVNPQLDNELIALAAANRSSSMRLRTPLSRRPHCFNYACPSTEATSAAAWES